MIPPGPISWLFLAGVIICRGEASYERQWGYSEVFQEVKCLNTAVASQQVPAELKRPGMLQRLSSGAARWRENFLYLFRTRENLASTMVDSVVAENFLAIKLKAMELAIKEFPDDPIVAALVSSIEEPAAIRRA